MQNLTEKSSRVLQTDIRLTVPEPHPVIHLCAWGSQDTFTYAYTLMMVKYWVHGVRQERSTGPDKRVVPWLREYCFLIPSYRGARVQATTLLPNPVYHSLSDVLYSLTTFARTPPWHGTEFSGLTKDIRRSAKRLFLCCLTSLPRSNLT